MGSARPQGDQPVVETVRETLGTARAELGLACVAWTAAATILVGILIAIPTAIVENPFFTRMTPVEPEQYVVWVLTSLLSGALLATYVAGAFRGGGASRATGAGLLGVFAVGCPICNKLVVGLLGTSGALSYFAPMQPVIGAAAVALAGWALLVRLRRLAEPSCTLAPPATTAPPRRLRG
jgi:hypothetical protein